MAIKIPITFTHEWSKVIQIVKLVSVFFIAFLTGACACSFIDSDIIFLIFFILGFFGGIFIGFYRLWDYLDTLSTYLYVRISLRTPIDLKEVKALKYFFEPNKTGKWYPMTHLRKLPKEMRKIALFESVKKLMSGD